MSTGSERLGRLTRSFYLDQGARVAKLKEQDMAIFRLDIGSPDMPPPDDVVQCLVDTARQDHTHGYQSHIGPLELRMAWAEAYLQWFDVSLSPANQIQPVLGTKDGIFNLTQALVNPGDVVIVPDPAYPTYTESAHFAGAEVIRMPLSASSRWLPDLDALAPSILDRASLLWINYPNNPTGATCPLSLFEHAVELAHRHGFLVCHDAAYCQVTYDGCNTPSILQVPGADNTALEFNSLSKTFNMAGWRMGVLVGNAHAVSALRKLKAQSESGQFLPAAKAASAALSVSKDWIASRNSIYKKRRDALIQALGSIPSLEFDKPEAGMYLWIRLPAGENSLSYSLALMQETGICTAPGTIYGQGGEGYLRISLAAPETSLVEAAGLWKEWELDRKP